MTLSEAARSGRTFWRKSEPGVRYHLEGKQIVAQEPPGAPRPVEVDAEMLVAVDWEPEPLKLELTAIDIARAARGLDELVSKRRLSAAEFARHLSLELGLLEDA